MPGMGVGVLIHKNVFSGEAHLEKMLKASEVVGLKSPRRKI